MKDTKLTVTIHIGGQKVEKLTADQVDKMAQRVGEAMSSYYTAHPDEFKQLK